MLIATLTSLLLIAGTAPQQPQAVGTAERICARFDGFDMDRDGRVEIRRAHVVHEAGDAGPRALVLVEPRLWQTGEGQRDLRPAVRRLVDDLAAEGHRAAAITIDLALHERHQDGRYLLAMRELLRAFAADGELRAALLFGHFPDALLVRTCNWRKRETVTLRRGTKSAQTYEKAHLLRRVPEPVADRADLVLADLDGHWEDLYVQPRTALPRTHVVFDGPIPARGGVCRDHARGTGTFADFFHVQDGTLSLRETPDGLVADLDNRAGGGECSEADRSRPNVIARPDILVSRIDARGTAMAVDPELTGVDGNGLLDADGRPRAVAFAAGKPPSWRRIWRFDPALERQLLAEYLDRNHAFRTGTAATAWRPSSLACDLPSGYRNLARADDAWLPKVADRSDLRGRTTLVDAANWFAFPAVLRTIRAHSDPWGAVFRKQGVGELHQRIGGPAWSWSASKDRLVPSLHAPCRGGKLDWHLLHTLWRNGAVAAAPSIYLHTGCRGISPPDARKRAFDHPGYGRMQGGEAVLLFGNGVALVGRAKVFYDEPRGFAETLGAGGTVGDAWARYYELESSAASWGRVGGDIGRKRSYFWSVLGDATLRLRPSGRGR